MDSASTIPLSILIFFVAALYSSVGHGGASGYLAVLSFFSVGQIQMASTALILNVIVATLSTVAYVRAGFFRLKLTWPFLATSIPAAFLGGTVHLDNKTYFLLLALILVFAAARLFFTKPIAEVSDYMPMSTTVALTSGAAIGVLSGVVGVGGGIFLSPLIMLFRWADAKETAATSAVFIVVNSVAGILGRASAGNFDIQSMTPLLVAAGTGGIVGSYMGANKFSRTVLAKILAAVLVLAAVKLTITAH